VVLGKIRQMEQAGKADLIVVDAPASGHAISLLTSAAGMADSTTGGPIRQQADQVLAMLADEARCQVMLVTQPEETPVTETIETAFALEDDVGVTLAPVVVNGLWPDIPGLATALTRAERSETADPDAVAAARYRLGRIDDQSAQVSRLDQELPLPRVHLPYLFTTSIGPGEISTLARAFTGEPT